VRVALDGERGMGLRFVELDADSRKLVDRIVDANSREPAPVPVEQTAAGASGRARRRVRARHGAHHAVGGDGRLLHV